MQRAFSCALAALAIFATAEGSFAEISLWSQPYTSLSSLEENGWNKRDFRPIECGIPADDLRACQYLLLNHSNVYAFADTKSDRVYAISVECTQDARCNRSQF